VGLDRIRFNSTFPREIPMIGVLIKLAHAGVKKIWSVEPRFAGVVVSRGEEQFAESTTRMLTVGRKSEQRSLARRQRRAPRRRKLVSCFVAKVKTVTLLSALLVAALLVCERTRTRALGRPSRA